MKNLKSVLTIFAVLCLLISFAACSAPVNEPDTGGQPAPAAETPAPTPTPEPPTAEEIVVAAMGNMQEVKSMDATMTSELDIEMMGQRQSSSTVSKMTSFTDPQRMKMDVEMSMMGEKIEMRMYMEQEGDVLNIYTSVTDQWTKTEAPIGEYDKRMSQYDAKGSMDIYLNNAKNFESAGQETVGGVNTEKIQGFLSDEDLGNAIMESGSLDDMLQGWVVVGPDDLNSMLKDLGDMPMTIWVDKENLLAVKFEFDMTKVLDALYKNIFGTMSVDADSIITHKYVVAMEYHNMNNATPFTIPPEAKEAA